MTGRTHAPGASWAPRPRCARVGASRTGSRSASKPARARPRRSGRDPVVWEAGCRRRPTPRAAGAHRARARGGARRLVSGTHAHCKRPGRGCLPTEVVGPRPPGSRRPACPTRTLTLTPVAALAVSALAAPAAHARPADTLSPQARNAAATAASHRVASDRVQDLRRLHASQSRRVPRDRLAFTPGLHARRAPRTRGLYSRAQPRSPLQAEYHASYTTPPAGQQPARSAGSDDSAPWTMIALGLGGAFLLIAMLAVARRARLRTHIAA